MVFPCSEFQEVLKPAMAALLLGLQAVGSMAEPGTHWLHCPGEDEHEAKEDDS